MAAVVTPSSGKYFWDNPSVWQESVLSGVAPFWVGDMGGKIAIPNEPTPEFFKDLCEGKKYLARVQHNRVGCYDRTFTFSKEVSLVLYGLAGLENWEKSTRMVIAVTRPEVEAHVNDQRANSGAQGKEKVVGKGIALAFPHFRSYSGESHANIHYVEANLVATAAGEVKSMAEVLKQLFNQQGVCDARVQKRMDDLLRAEGYRTVLVGKRVGIAGIPREMVEELSPARRAMNHAQEEKKFTGPKAQDYYARQARQDAGPRREPAPQEIVRRVQELAQTHKVTLEALKSHGPAPHLADKVKAASVAYDVAKEARETCLKKYGSFTPEQYMERVYLRGIGRETTLVTLEKFGRAALEKPRRYGLIRQKSADGTVRYTSKEVIAARREKEAQKQASRWEVVAPGTPLKAHDVTPANQGLALHDLGDKIRVRFINQKTGLTATPIIHKDKLTHPDGRTLRAAPQQSQNAGQQQEAQEKTKKKKQSAPVYARGPDGPEQFVAPGLRHETANLPALRPNMSPAVVPPQGQSGQQQTQQGQQQGSASQSQKQTAWQEFVQATKDLGGTIVVKGMKAATKVIKRLKEIIDPPPLTIVIKAKEAPDFIRRHTRSTSYLWAHAKALARGAFAPGNPHDKAAAAERYFAQYRHRERLPKKTTLVVTGAQKLSEFERRQLNKIAKRDRAADVQFLEKPKKAKTRGKSHNQSQAQSRGRNP